MIVIFLNLILERSPNYIFIFFFFRKFTNILLVLWVFYTDIVMLFNSYYPLLLLVYYKPTDLLRVLAQSGAWDIYWIRANYQLAIPMSKNYTCSIIHNLPKPAHLVIGPHLLSNVCLNFDGLSSVKYLEGNYSFCEVMNTIIMLNIRQHFIAAFSIRWLFHQHNFPFSHEKTVVDRCFLQGWTVNNHFFSAVWLVKYLFLKCWSLQKEASLIKLENISNHYSLTY